MSNENLIGFSQSKTAGIESCCQIWMSDAAVKFGYNYKNPTDHTDIFRHSGISLKFGSSTGSEIKVSSAGTIESIRLRTNHVRNKVLNLKTLLSDISPSDIARLEALFQAFNDAFQSSVKSEAAPNGFKGMPNLVGSLPGVAWKMGDQPIIVTNTSLFISSEISDFVSKQFTWRSSTGFAVCGRTDSKWVFGPNGLGFDQKSQNTVVTLESVPTFASSFTNSGLSFDTLKAALNELVAAYRSHRQKSYEELKGLTFL